MLISLLFIGFISQLITRLCVSQEFFFPNGLELFSMAQGSISQHELRGPFATRSAVVLIKMQILKSSPDPQWYSEFSSDTTIPRNFKTTALGEQRPWPFCKWAHGAQDGICLGKSRISVRPGIRIEFLNLCHIDRLCRPFVVLFALSGIWLGFATLCIEVHHYLIWK